MCLFECPTGNFLVTGPELLNFNVLCNYAFLNIAEVC